MSNFALNLIARFSTKPGGMASLQPAQGFYVLGH